MSMLKFLSGPYHVVKSILKTAIGYSPVVQLFCAVFKRSASSCHVHLQLGGIHNKIYAGHHKQTARWKNSKHDCIITSGIKMAQWLIKLLPNSCPVVVN